MNLTVSLAFLLKTLENVLSNARLSQKAIALSPLTLTSDRSSVPTSWALLSKSLKGE